MNWTTSIVSNANWKRVLIWLFLYIVTSVSVFFMPGPWSRLGDMLGATNGIPHIPSTLSGFPADQPAAIFLKLGDDLDQLLWFQLIDFPLLIASAGLTISILAVALKKFKLGNRAQFCILIVPILYVLLEVIENTLLAGMVLEILPTDDSFRLMQQLATNAKITTDTAGSLTMFIALLALSIAAIVRLFRKKSEV